MFGHSTYLVFELAWALPVLVLQWIAGPRRLWHERVILLAAVLLSTVYLTAADSAAIAHGIWTLAPTRIVGLRIGNVPIEEAIFFLVTNSMVVQTVLLVGVGPAERDHWNLEEQWAKYVQGIFNLMIARGGKER